MSEGTGKQTLEQCGVIAGPYTALVITASDFASLAKLPMVSKCLVLVSFTLRVSIHINALAYGLYGMTPVKLDASKDGRMP